jgi:hypothetical protein
MFKNLKNTPLVAMIFEKCIQGAGSRTQDKTVLAFFPGWERPQKSFVCWEARRRRKIGGIIVRVVSRRPNFLRPGHAEAEAEFTSRKHHSF